MKSIFLLILGLTIAGCSSHLAKRDKPKAPANQKPVDASAIAVIPNPYVDDEALANKAANESKQELIRRGYNVVANESEAKLIAVPTVETDVVTAISHTSIQQPINMFTNSNLGQLDRGTISNSIGSLGQISVPGSGSFGKGQDQLVIEAFPKDAWDHALIVNELQLQPAWKIRMPLPADLKPIEGEKIAHAADRDFQLPH